MPLRRPPCPEDPSRHFLDGQSHLKLLRVGFQRALGNFAFWTGARLLRLFHYRGLDGGRGGYICNLFPLLERLLHFRTLSPVENLAILCLAEAEEHFFATFIFPLSYGISASLRWARIFWATLNFAYPIWVCDRLYQSSRTFQTY